MGELVAGDEPGAEPASTPSRLEAAAETGVATADREPAAPAAAGAAEASAFGAPGHRAALPELIPPTPEPPALTRKAVPAPAAPGADMLLAELAAASTAGFAKAEPDLAEAARLDAQRSLELLIESAALDDEGDAPIGPARLAETPPAWQEPSPAPASIGPPPLPHPPRAPAAAASRPFVSPPVAEPPREIVPPPTAPAPAAEAAAAPTEPVTSAPTPPVAAPPAPASVPEAALPAPTPPAPPTPIAAAPQPEPLPPAAVAPIAPPAVAPQLEPVPPALVTPIAPPPAASRPGLAPPAPAPQFVPTAAAPPELAPHPPAPLAPAPADPGTPAPPAFVPGPAAPPRGEDAVPAPVPAEGAPRERARVPMRPQWPAPETGPVSPAWWSRPWIWAAVVVLLFAGGWYVGGLQPEREVGNSGVLSRSLRALGLGGARFDVTIQSHPTGAWIAVNGKDLARRTPASIDLPAGTHQVDLSFSDLGSARFQVRGARGDRVALDAPLWGSLTVYASDNGIPVNVEVDGVAHGLAPVTVDSLSPGAHDVRFSGPGLLPWGQTVQVRVKEESRLVARPVTSPATGVLEVRAKWTDTEGSEDLTGATVYIDGEKRGVTPLTLELPRGPHSARVESRGESSPVQVIDLPGGNQRFATFELGLLPERPHMDVLGAPIRVSLDQPTVISTVVFGATPDEIREIWLHVRQPDGAWRRYPMEMMRSPTGVVGTAVFPNTLLDAHGQTAYYCSATSQTGDDSYTEVLVATEASPDKQ
jgi:hypothetical protein